MVYSNLGSEPFACDGDTVNIYNTTTHRSIVTICGNDRWLLIFKGHIRVIFQTDSSYRNTGFLYKYHEDQDHTRCGGTLVASSLPQLITSPGFPNSYYGLLNCTWIIKTATENEVILLETVSSDIERYEDASGRYCHDYVTVTDGVSGQWLGTYCGVDEPVFLSGGNSLLVNFVSDHDLAYTGFQLKYTSISVSGSNVQFPASKTQLGIISPGYQRRYPDNVNCTWTIVPGSSLITEIIHVNIQTLDVRGGPGNCTQDKIYINSRYKNGTDSLATLCNNQTGQLNYSIEGQVTLKFITDSSVVGRGFRLTYQATPAQVTCAEKYMYLVAEHTWQYIVSSSYYPYFYSINTSCSWTIRTPYHNSRVRFDTIRSSFEMTGGCSAGYLGAYDGNSSSSPLLGKWCGSTRPSIVSSGQYLTIVFHTPFYNTHQGFKIRYKTQNGSAPQCDSRNITTSQDFDYNELTSPGYSDKYQNNMACTWTIHAPSGHVKVYIIYMDIESSPGCENDYLKLTDGTDPFSRVIGQLCGSQKQTYYYSTGNYMTIRFVTNGSVVGGGFRLWYKDVYTAPTAPTKTSNLITDGSLMTVSTTASPSPRPTTKSTKTLQSTSSSSSNSIASTRGLTTTRCSPTSTSRRDSTTRRLMTTRLSSTPKSRRDTTTRLLMTTHLSSTSTSRRDSTTRRLMTTRYSPTSTLRRDSSTIRMTTTHGPTTSTLKHNIGMTTTQRSQTSILRPVSTTHTRSTTEDHDTTDAHVTLSKQTSGRLTTTTVSLTTHGLTTSTINTLIATGELNSTTTKTTNVTDTKASDLMLKIFLPLTFIIVIIAFVIFVALKKKRSSKKVDFSIKRNYQNPLFETSTSKN